MLKKARRDSAVVELDGRRTGREVEAARIAGAIRRLTRGDMAVLVLLMSWKW